MPTYEYLCTNCNKATSLVAKINDLPPKSCNLCGENTLELQLSALSICFKGAGWPTKDIKQRRK